jgi:histidinol-phosphatase (PHP family)
MAQAAHAAGYDILGFSSHAPLPFDTSWNLKWPRYADYGAAIEALKKKWIPEGMTVLLGLEIDHIEGMASPRDEAYGKINLDYRIGSVHFITKLQGGLFTVDENEKDFSRHVTENAEGDARRIWKEYYRNLEAMIEKGGFDIVGHFDLVKKNNSHGRYFDEGSGEYLSAAFDAVEAASRNNTIVEINTGGIARGKTDEPYPSLSILKRMRERSVRITLGDDAHAPDHLGKYQKHALELAKTAGYDELWYLDVERIWKPISIAEVGKPLRN